jgi:hypothetical protein
MTKWLATPPIDGPASTILIRVMAGVHDLNATMLQLLGINHEQLTFRHQGRDFRLTDVFGKVLGDLLT